MHLLIVDFSVKKKPGCQNLHSKSVNVEQKNLLLGSIYRNKVQPLKSNTYMKH